METRIYVINVNDERAGDINVPLTELSDDEFMFEAEEQGKIYTLKGFEKDFNEEMINTHTDIIRFINTKIKWDTEVK